MNHWMKAQKESLKDFGEIRETLKRLSRKKKNCLNTLRNHLGTAGKINDRISKGIFGYSQKNPLETVIRIMWNC